MNVPLALFTAEPPKRDATLGEQVYKQLCELLISGQLAPGDRLSLRNAAEILGVSIMPVREAVSRLVSDGGLEVAPNRAVRVPIMSSEQFRDLTRVRIVLEGHAAAEAALARDDDDIASIRKAEADFRAMSQSENPDLPRSVELNKILHFDVYQAARSPVLVEIVRGLWLKAGPVLNLDLRASPERLRTGGAVACHAELLNAIVARDAEAARMALAKDIQNAADYILSRGRLAD